MTAPATSAANTNQAAQEPIQPASNPEPEPAPVAAVAVAADPKPAPAKRRSGRALLMLSVPLVLAAAGAYVWATGGRYEETDNANLRQARLTVAAETAGRIVSSNVAENMAVKAGDTLFVIDPAP